MISKSKCGNFENEFTLRYLYRCFRAASVRLLSALFFSFFSLSNLFSLPFSYPGAFEFSFFFFIHSFSFFRSEIIIRINMSKNKFIFLRQSIILFWWSVQWIILRGPRKNVLASLMIKRFIEFTLAVFVQLFRLELSLGFDWSWKARIQSTNKLTNTPYHRVRQQQHYYRSVI